MRNCMLTLYKENLLFMLKTIICGHGLKAHSGECFGGLNDNSPPPPNPHESLVAHSPPTAWVNIRPIYGNQDFEIQEIKFVCEQEYSLRNCRNPRSTNKESEIQFLESGITCEESRVQDYCLGFPCMERYEYGPLAFISSPRSYGWHVP